MAGEWRPSTWGKEIFLEYGKALRGYDEAQGRYRVFGANGPIGWTSQPLVQGPGVVLGRKGAYRGVQYSPEPFFVIDTAYYVVPKSTLDMRWLYYAIKHYKLGEVDDGSPIPSTTRAAVYVLDLDVPPPAEQRAIAGILGTLDDKIELNRRMNETLEATARTLFKDWFVDFGPTRAKFEGRERYLHPDIWSLFPDRFDKDGKPEAWHYNALSVLAEITSGKRPELRSDHATPEAQIPIYGGAGAMAYTASSLFTKPLLLTGRVGTLGIVHRITFPIWPSDNTLIVLPRSEEIFEFLYFHLNVLDLISLNRGSTQPLLTQSDLGKQIIATPQHKLLVKFSQQTKKIFQCIDRNLAETKTLAATRDFLLPRLMSGEVRVNDAISFL